MDWFSTGLIMGAVQGLTEFLPVSSSGHLVIAGDLLGFTGPKASTFEVAIQLGSIFAVLMVYWDRFMGLLLPGRVQTSAPKPFAGLRGIWLLFLTTLPPSEQKDGSNDFFGKPTSLAVTGQLEAETFAMAFSKVYTFGPTFRAENSNTKTHAAEFWMIEPEIAFCDIHQLMDIEEDFLKYLVKTVLEKCSDELEFLDKFTGGGLLDKLNHLAVTGAARITHEEAITILRKVKDRFQFEPKYGEDTAKEHEKYLTEEYFHSPVFVYDWPKDIKAFYMYQNDDGKTVAAVDLLVPGAGELMGGSQRETRLDKLTERMDALHISKDAMYWYVNLRKFGGCTHSGFGMGFERLLIYLTGVDNIRDVIPYARTPMNCEF